MHINVRDILAEDLGYNRTFSIAGEEPTLDSVVLTQPINGDVRVSRLEVGVIAEGEISTEIELECHRCLRTFTQPMHVRFAQVFTPEPHDDELPIEDDQIDLALVMQQELIVNLPIKILDRPDCPGIETDAVDTTGMGKTIASKARITKGP